MSYPCSQYSQTMAPSTSSSLTAGKSSHLNFLTTPPKKSTKPVLIQRLDSVGESVPSFDEEPYITSNNYTYMSTHTTDKNRNVPSFTMFPGKSNWSSPAHCQMYIPPMSQGLPMHNNNQSLHANYSHFHTEKPFHKQPYCTKSLLGLPLMPHVHGQLLQYIPPCGPPLNSQDIFGTATTFGPNYSQPFCPTTAVNIQSQHYQAPPIYQFFQSAQPRQKNQPTMRTQISSGSGFKPTEMPMSKLDQVTQNIENLSVSSELSAQDSSDITSAGGVMAGHSSLTPERASVNNNGKQVNCNISLSRSPVSIPLPDLDNTQSRTSNTLNVEKCTPQPPSTAEKMELQEKQQKETANIDISLFDEAVLASDNLTCDILLEMSDLIPKKYCEEKNSCRTPKADVKTKVDPSTLSTPDCFLKPKVPVKKKKVPTATLR